MKFVVAHSGARRGYAVPAILERAGILERFYTDIAADVGLGRIISSLPIPDSWNSDLDRLRSRRLPQNIVNKTETFAWPNLKFYLSLKRYSSPAQAYLRNVAWQSELGRRMASRGFGEATWLHSFLDEFPTLITAAKNHGLRIVSELYILLSADRIVREERRRFPHWEEDEPECEAVVGPVLSAKRVLFTHSDYVLCPSEAVLNDAVQNFGFSAEQCRIVPYGVGEQWFGISNEPEVGRVLFAGTADLRKGIHYFAMAAEKLKEQGRPYEFRVAGGVQPLVRRQKACRHIDFLGRLPRDQIKEEFAKADVLVLPTLAEGSAGVTYEALAAGVPVITTKAAGSVVRDGVEGRVIRERDCSALADAILELTTNRQKRNRMAAAAHERAKDFTWGRYGERLVAALCSLTASRT